MLNYSYHQPEDLTTTIERVDWKIGMKPKVQPKAKHQTEKDWEEKILNLVLKDMVDDDGNIDFDNLRSKGANLTLETLYDNGNTAINP